MHRLYGGYHLWRHRGSILQDFNPNDVHHIVNHSESVFLFTSDAIWEHLEEERLTGLRGVFSLNDFRCLYQRDGETIQRFSNIWVIKWKKLIRMVSHGKM